MKRKIAIFIILFAFIGLVSPSTSFAVAEFQSFSGSLSFTSSCQPTLTFSVSINPSTMTNGNNFVVSVNPLDEDGEVIYQQGGTATSNVTSSSQDHAVTVPMNGVVSNQTINISQSINVLTTYRLQMSEYNANGNFQDSSSYVEVVPTQGSCPPQNTSSNQDTQPSVNLEYTEINIENPISINSVPELVEKVFEFLIKIGIPLLVVMIVYSGWLYLFARGNPGEIKKAHDMFLYTLIGGAILLSAWAIAQLIHSTLIDLTASIVTFFV